MDTYAVIMAGGAGTRFWPMSRKRRPKQLLPLGPGGEPLLAATVRRIASLVPADRIYVVTASVISDAVAAMLRGRTAASIRFTCEFREGNTTGPAVEQSRG